MPLLSRSPAGLILMAEIIIEEDKKSSSCSPTPKCSSLTVTDG